MKKQILDNANATSSSKQIAILKQHFPACFDKDGKFMPDKLAKIAQAEGADISREGYSLNWLGKSYARLMANLNTETLLAANTEHNAMDENKTSENILIQGDNLDVLKHLKNAYAEQIKMIYIDPPYNTGSDGFAYQDDRKFTVEELAGLAGIEEDEAKRILEFTNSSSSSHSAWLTFMYPRLYIAKEFLTEDGAIFISIDDNEQSQLKILCDEVFGEGNFIGQIVWKNVTDNNPSNIAIEHEYVLAYAKQKESLEPVWKSKVSDVKDLLIDVGAEFLKTWPDAEERQKEYTKWFRENKSQLWPLENYKFIDGSGVFSGERGVHNPGKEGYRYDILHPLTNRPCKEPLMGYRFPQSTMEKMIEEGRIIFGDDENKLVEIKVYAKDYKQKLSSVLTLDGRTGTNELKELFPELKKVFTNPKTVRMLDSLISFVTKEDSLVMDFFSGSGSTAHALMALNAGDEGKRRHITIQIDEATDPKSEAYKHNFKTIYQITRERILRAAKKIQTDNPDAEGDFGFKEFKTTPVFDGYLNEADTPDQYTIFEGDKLSDEQRAQLLLTWQVYDGLPLTLDLETVDLEGYTAHQGNHILYCINSGLTLDHILKMLERIDTDKSFAPQKVVVFEYILSSKAKREIMEAVKGYNNRKQIELHLEIRL